MQPSAATDGRRRAKRSRRVRRRKDKSSQDDDARTLSPHTQNPHALNAAAPEPSASLKSAENAPAVPSSYSPASLSGHDDASHSMTGEMQGEHWESTVARDTQSYINQSCPNVVEHSVVSIAPDEGDNVNARGEEVLQQSIATSAVLHAVEEPPLHYDIGGAAMEQERPVENPQFLVGSPQPRGERLKGPQRGLRMDEGVHSSTPHTGPTLHADASFGELQETSPSYDCSTPLDGTSDFREGMRRLFRQRKYHRVLTLIISVLLLISTILLLHDGYIIFFDGVGETGKWTFSLDLVLALFMSGEFLFRVFAEDSSYSKYEAFFDSTLLFLCAGAFFFLEFTSVFQNKSLYPAASLLILLFLRLAARLLLLVRFAATWSSHGPVDFISLDMRNRAMLCEELLESRDIRGRNAAGGPGDIFWPPSVDCGTTVPVDLCDGDPLLDESTSVIIPLDLDVTQPGRGPGPGAFNRHTGPGPGAIDRSLDSPPYYEISNDSHAPTPTFYAADRDDSDQAAFVKSFDR